jgi:two-component system, NtrC family, sensor histidine kinase AtoS
MMHNRNLEPVHWILLGVAVLFVVLLLIALVRLLKRTSARQTADPITPSADSYNNQQFMMATFQGVIQRLKEQERELERLHRLERERADFNQKVSENITRNMPTGLITINRNGIITSSNPAAKEIVQLQLLENMHYKQILASHSCLNLNGVIENCLQTGTRYHRAEIEVTLNNSRSKTLGISLSPIESDKQAISGVVCLMTDLTELVALKKQLHIKEGLAILGEMSAGIAHEFKNSLATIYGYAQILQDEKLPPALNDTLKVIRKEASELTATINEFLNFAKPQSLNRKRLDLCELLSDCVHEMAMDSRFKHIDFNFAGQPCSYEGDGLLLKSAFSNLLLNAAESVPRNGKPGNVSCQLQNFSNIKPHQVLIRFNDSGCGIKTEDLEKVFIPFFTRKSEGTGLGLAIVQKIILMHDGKIEVESSVEQGACFKVYL